MSTKMAFPDHESLFASPAVRSFLTKVLKQQSLTDNEWTENFTLIHKSLYSLQRQSTGTGNWEQTPTFLTLRELCYFLVEFLSDHILPQLTDLSGIQLVRKYAELSKKYDLAIQRFSRPFKQFSKLSAASGHPRLWEQGHSAGPLTRYDGKEKVYDIYVAAASCKNAFLTGSMHSLWRMIIIDKVGSNLTSACQGYLDSLMRKETVDADPAIKVALATLHATQPNVLFDPDANKDANSSTTYNVHTHHSSSVPVKAVKEHSYEEMFQKKFVKTTVEYYRGSVKTTLESDLGVPAFIEQTSMWIEDVTAVCALTLDGTRAAVLNPLLELFVSEHIADITEALPALFAQSRHSHLTKLYALMTTFEKCVEGTKDGKQKALKCLQDLANEFGKSLRHSLQSSVEKLAATMRGSRLEKAQKTHAAAVKAKKKPPPIPELSEIRVENIRANPIEYVNAFWDVYLSFKKIHVESFESDRRCEKAMLQAMEAEINHNELNRGIKKGELKEARPAELIAEYVDTRLSNGARSVTVTEETLDSFKECVVYLYGCVRSKDIFNSHYTVALADRLLSGSCANVDHERAMMSAFKEAMSQLHAEISKVIRGWELCETDFNKYHESRKDKGSSVDDLSHVIRVFRKNALPSKVQEKEKIPLPGVVGAAWNRFETYLSQDDGLQGRCYDLLLAKSTADIVVNGYYVIVNTVQLAILTLLDPAQSPLYKASEGPHGTWGATVQQLADQLNVPCSFLQAHADSMLRARLLGIMVPKGPDGKRSGSGKFGPSAILVFRASKFSAKSRKVTLSKVNEKFLKTKKTEDITEDTLKSRGTVVDAAVVRIMKSKNRVPHHELVSEVVKALANHFTVPPRLLKRRIEDLIDQEYLERDPNEAQTYLYIA